MRAAGIDGAEIELSRILACRGDHVLQVLERRIRLDRKQHLEASRNRYECEVGQHVVGARLEQGHGDGLPVSDHVKRVTVRWRFEHFLGREEAGGSRTIFDDDLLLRSLGQFLREEAHGQVGDAAGAIGNENVDWLGGEAWL